MQNQATIREFVFENEDFRELADIVYEKSGITLGDHKKDMVYGRLARRLRELQLQTFSHYIDYVRNDQTSSEVEQLINAVTTNLTRFFREKHHFDHVQHTVIPELIKRKASQIRFWSAACASGPEPYSLAMASNHTMTNNSLIDFKILATDLDTTQLKTARSGIYNNEILKDIPEAFRKEYTKPCKDKAGHFKIRKCIRSLISFNQMNLMKEWPMKGTFDVIFCRNVLIYFNAKDKAWIISRLIEKLKPGGYLYMGHAESILNPPTEIKSVGTTTYQRRSL